MGSGVSLSGREKNVLLLQKTERGIRGSKARGKNSISPLAGGRKTCLGTSEDLFQGKEVGGFLHRRHVEEGGVKKTPPTDRLEKSRPCLILSGKAERKKAFHSLVEKGGRSWKGPCRGKPLRSIIAQKPLQNVPARASENIAVMKRKKKRLKGSDQKKVLNIRCGATATS